MERKKTSYKPKEHEPREFALLNRPRLIISSKDDALQAIIFLLSEWEIQPQEVVEEYNKLVH